MQSEFNLEGFKNTPEIAASLQLNSIVAPTEVQVSAFPLILSKQHVALTSGTGTGKTLAYVLPLLQRAKEEPTFRAVVMAPSPELAVQILRTVEVYKDQNVKCVGLVGGGNPERQRDKLKKHPQIMVGTPGRVLEFIFARKIKTQSIGALVLDEVDEILSPENEDGLREICSRPEFAAQLLCVSATIGERAKAFMDAYMRTGSAVAKGGEQPLLTNISHGFVLVNAQNQQSKEGALLQLLARKRIKRAMVFVNKIYNASHLFRMFEEQGIACATLTAERDKQARERAIQLGRGEKPCILIATDTAARGLDIKGIEWVIHYEVARNAATYLHRAGRTGRAGKHGQSVVMVKTDEMYLLDKHSKALGVNFERVS